MAAVVFVASGAVILLFVLGAVWLDLRSNPLERHVKYQVGDILDAPRFPTNGSCSMPDCEIGFLQAFCMLVTIAAGITSVLSTQLMYESCWAPQSNNTVWHLQLDSGVPHALWRPIAEVPCSTCTGRTLCFSSLMALWWIGWVEGCASWLADFAPQS